MSEPSPGVRRLCVLVAAEPAGLLARACRSVGLDGLYIEPDGVLEIGFAVPGVDEAALVGELVTALRRQAVRGHGDAGTPSPVAALAAFHVGITRVTGDSLGGTAVTRLWTLLHDAALLDAIDAEPDAVLAVAMTSGMFDDVAADCGFGADDGWAPLPEAGARFRMYRHEENEVERAR